MGSRTHVVVVLLAALVLLTAGCAADGVPSSSLPVTTPGGAASGRVSPAPPPAPRPTEVAGPPAATLAATGGEQLAGELGTFTWLDLGSDAPWIVPPPGRKIEGRGPFTVAFDPAMPVERWTAGWARVAASGAGTPSDGGRGTGSSVSLKPPSSPGTWGLQVHAWFGPDRHATWYWRVEVRP
jgi:hypothetical protein